MKKLNTLSNNKELKNTLSNNKETYIFTTSDYELLSKPFPTNPCEFCFNDAYGDHSNCDDCQRMRDYIASLNSYKNKNILELASVIHNIFHNLTEVLEDLFLISKDLDTINDYIKHASDESDALNINNTQFTLSSSDNHVFRTFNDALYNFCFSQIKFVPGDDKIYLTRPAIREIYGLMNFFHKYYESVKNPPNKSTDK